MDSTPNNQSFDSAMLQALLDVHRQLELSAQLEVLLRVAHEWSGAEAGFMFMRDSSQETFVCRNASIPRGDPRRDAITRVDSSVLLEAMGDGGRCQRWDRFGPFEPEPGEWPGEEPPSSVALKVGDLQGRPEAVLLLLGPPEGADPDIERILCLLEGAIPALENAHRVGSMKELIIQDDTAKCFNRRHFEESFPEELSRAARFRSALSLIFFDLDNLKMVNSLHGHAMGSRTLYEVSLRVRNKIRKFDKLFRFGGDEFCILLPETEWNGALEVAERVRESIAGKPFLSGYISDPQGVKVTASFGIASFPLHARSKEEMIQKADRAMQKVKSGTKNSIAIAEITGDKDGSR